MYIIYIPSSVYIYMCLSIYDYHITLEAQYMKILALDRYIDR